MSFIAVGDVHGCKGHLEQMIAKLARYEHATIIFLGDYIDIGPDSKGVIELLLNFSRNRERVYCLAGNHEYELLRFLEKGDFARYARKGGLPTIRSYCGKLKGDVRSALLHSIPESHLEFLRNLRPWYETAEFLFSHSGYDPADPTARSFEKMVKTTYPDLLTSNGTLGKQAICGHYYQHSFKPLVTPHLVVTDTGCGILGGPLTAVEVPSYSCVQVSERDII